MQVLQRERGFSTSPPQPQPLSDPASPDSMPPRCQGSRGTRSHYRMERRGRGSVTEEAEFSTRLRMFKGQPPSARGPVASLTESEEVAVFAWKMQGGADAGRSRAPRVHAPVL